MGSCPPNSPLATDPEYLRLMNTTTETASMTALSTPMGEWFTELSTDIQGDIAEMVNENGYPLSDIREFIEQYGADAYASGHYVTWCELTERSGADNDAIEAFVEEFGIHCLDGFEDAYRGEYDSEADFAEQYTNDCYTDTTALPGWVVIDWQATWDNEVSSSFTYNNGYVFFSEF